jgi:alkylhydroperoxidase/carboxymuconolactone decarboxylase family protein YurZ
VLRLGATEKGITELLALGEHLVGLSVTAAGLLLEPDTSSSAVQVELDEHVSHVDDLDEIIASWARINLDADRIPAYWNVLRAQPKFREAHWRVHELVLGAGEFDAKAKGLIALAVASFRASPYWTTYFTQYCRIALGASVDEVREAVLMAAHAASVNTVAHGSMLKARHDEMRASDFHD